MIIISCNNTSKVKNTTHAHHWWEISESSMALETRLEIESSLDTAKILILSCFLAFESNIFWVLWATADPSPNRSPVEARTILIGIPTLLVKVTIEATSKAVIAVLTEVSLIVDAIARRLKRFVSLSRASTYWRKNLSTSSIFLSRYAWLSSGGAVASISGYIFFS